MFIVYCLPFILYYLLDFRRNFSAFMTQLTIHEKSSCKDAKFFDTMKKVLPRIHINRKKCIFAGSLCDLLLKDFA